VFTNYTDDVGNPVGGSQAFADVTVALDVPAPSPPWALIVAGIVGGAIAAVIALRLYLSAIEQTVIDEVFLLHRDGLLVKHYTRRLTPDVDSDILSGMLIAVQNFVNESFIGESGLRKEGQLDEMKFGQYRILLVRGMHVIVAAVVSGPRVEKVPAQIRAAIEDLEGALSGVLEKWDGNMDQVSGADAFMQDLIAGRYRNPAKVRRGNH
jgi:OOP family OmpA-OmpF porin